MYLKQNFVQAPRCGRIEKFHEVGLDSWHNRLRFRVAETYIELKNFRTGFGKHETNVENPLKHYAFGRATLEKGGHDG